MSTAPVVKLAGVGAAANNFTSTSYTPEANSKELAWVVGYKSSAGAGLPTIKDSTDATGANWHYLADRETTTFSNPAIRGAWFISDDTGPTPAARTATITSASASGIEIILFDVLSVDTNGTLAQAAVSGEDLSTGDPSCTFGSTPGAATITLLGAAFGGGNLPTKPASFTSLANAVPIASRYISASYDITSASIGPNKYTSSNIRSIIVGIELAAAGAATQNITGALFTDGDTFYGATVTAGDVTITGALFSNSSSFFAATVSQAGAQQDITGALYANDNQFFGSTIANGITGGGGGSEWKKWYVPGLEKEEKAELKRIERTVKKKVAEAIETAGPGILSEGLEQIVKEEMADAAPVSSNAWLTPDVLQFIINRIEAQMRKAFVRKQQEAEDDDEDALILAA